MRRSRQAFTDFGGPGDGRRQAPGKTSAGSPPGLRRDSDSRFGAQAGAGNSIPEKATGGAGTARPAAARA